ncbi:MAG: hypothetical protein RLZZ165_1081 [Bacteroidota bacterium]
MDGLCRTLFESAGEGLIVVDHAGEIQMMNNRALEMFGYSREELVGQKIEILVPSDMRLRHERNHMQYMAHPVRRSMGIGMALSGCRKDGSTFPVEISLNHFEIGGQTCAMALISDITLRQVVERELEKLNLELEQRVLERTRELRDSQHLYAVIARNFPNGSIYVLDRDFRYIFAEGRELFRMGVTSDQLIGSSYLERLIPNVREMIEGKLEEVLRGHNMTFELDVEDKTYEMHAVPLRDADGIISRIMLVETNTTQQKRAAANIIKALEKERQLNELKSRFVSMASHEFRTPLSTILTSISLVSKYTGPEHEESRQKHYNRIRTSVHHLTSILNDFLSLDKLESGKLQSHPEEFDLKAKMEDLIDGMQAICKPDQSIVFTYEGDRTVKVDRNMFRNIVLNLISNAIKYSGEGQKVDVDTLVRDGKIHIDVRDHGIGIAESEKQHMFERFFRANNATNIQGTGLGLNIVRKYLDLMDGDIWFESELGKGSTFSIVLPQRLNE